MAKEKLSSALLGGTVQQTGKHNSWCVCPEWAQHGEDPIGGTTKTVIKCLPSPLEFFSICFLVGAVEDQMGGLQVLPASTELIPQLRGLWVNGVPLLWKALSVGS